MHQRDSIEEVLPSGVDPFHKEEKKEEEKKGDEEEESKGEEAKTPKVSKPRNRKSTYKKPKGAASRQAKLMLSAAQEKKQKESTAQKVGNNVINKMFKDVFASEAEIVQMKQMIVE